VLVGLWACYFPFGQAETLDAYTVVIRLSGQSS
jgi:hypothetical protein